MASVSVLMAVFNGMPYLPEAVDSVIGQSTSDWEFLVVNDGSTDGSAEYLNGLEDSRITVIHQENQGLAASLNNGLQKCSNEFVARLDSDDICLPQRLEKQIEFMQKHPEIGMLGTQIERMGQRKSGFRSSLPCQHVDIVEALLAGKHAMVHPTIMCRTELMKEVGGYWEHPIAQDWDLYLKLSEKSQIANLDQVFLRYRIHSGSLNGRKLIGIRLNQRYAAHCARQRAQGLPKIDLGAFRELERQRSLYWRVGEKVNVFAMHQYRLALTNILGGKPLVGYSRLGLSAACSPKLAFQRIKRMFAHRILPSVVGSRKPTRSVTQGDG